jgi:hypothetical protein
MPGWLTGSALKWIGGIVGALALAGALTYAVSTLRQGGRDAERADTNATVIETQERIKDADAAGPRTPDATERRLRDGSF